MLTGAIPSKRFLKDIVVTIKWQCPEEPLCNLGLQNCPTTESFFRALESELPETFQNNSREVEAIEVFHMSCRSKEQHNLSFRMIRPQGEVAGRVPIWRVMLRRLGEREGLGKIPAELRFTIER